VQRKMTDFGLLNVLKLFLRRSSIAAGYGCQLSRSRVSFPQRRMRSACPNFREPGEPGYGGSRWYDGLAQLGAELGERNEVANGRRRLIDKMSEETSLLFL
jgi:hypothetical protein